MSRGTARTGCRRAFTLIEVLVAMFVLATLSAGLLTTTWRLAAFARGQAEHLVADAYCHDVLWAVYSQSYTNMLENAAERSWEIDPEKHLPKVVSVDLFGNGKTECPLWRSRAADKKPRCRVRVNDGAEMTNRTIVVEVEWYGRDGRQTHSNVVARARVEREAR